MITKKHKKTSKMSSNSIYASRYDEYDLLLTEFSDEGMPSKVAKQFIEDELALEGTPALNLASFVTTWMEPEANELIVQCLNKNVIDHDEYPQIQEIHGRCVHMLCDMLHAPEAANYAGTATVGSSEAIMLAGLAHRFAWKKKRQAMQLDCTKPNIILGGNVQVCWEKFARYFDVEPKIIPLKDNQYTLTAADVEPLVDENTICVATILGTTYTGEYDEIKEINDLLVRVKKERGWDIPVHVDAASGGFISIFMDDKIEWDFRLEQVNSINISGHKYGLVYPGIGWLLFKDMNVIPEELIFNINYLGGNMPSYTLNFSNGSAMIVAQYYNFLRLGKNGYRKIVHNMMKISDRIAKALIATDKFILLGERRMEPVVTLALKDNSNYTVFDVSKELRVYNWLVPAYTMPANAQHIEVLRIVIKENMSLTLAQDFLLSVNKVLDTLEGKKNSLNRVTHGKYLR